MLEQTSQTGTIAGSSVRIRQQRIQTFIIALVFFNLPFLVIGYLDLQSSPLILVLALIGYAYFAVYYGLLRAGYGTIATYICTVVVLGLIGVGVHSTGGLMVATNVLYLLLLVTTGIVLNEKGALDIVAVLCVLGYSVMVLFEMVSPPWVLRYSYAKLSPLLWLGFVVAMLVALIGTWLLMRTNIVRLRASTIQLELARAKAEEHARENEELAAKVQSGNESLLMTQEHLRSTIEALTLPLIPLDQGVALLPLIGYLDEQRAERLVLGLLNGIFEQRAQVVILDITGLRDVDAHVATALLQTAQAARLLGARVILSGVGAVTAQTLVDLHADMRGFQTVSRLKDALQIASVVKTKA